MGIKKKKNSPRMQRTLLLLLLYNRGSGVYQPSVIPSTTTTPNDDRPGEGPSDKNRERDAPHAAANKGWNEGVGKNVFCPTRRRRWRRRLLCVRAKKGDAKRTAASDTIDCAIAGRDDIGGVGVGLCHYGSYRCSRTCARVRFTRSKAHHPVAERASQRRARVDKRSLSPPLSHQYTLVSAVAARRLRLFIYYIRHPHTTVASYIYIHRWQSSLVSLSSLNVTNPSWFIIAETIPCPTLSPLTRRYPPAPPQLCRFFLPPPPPPLSEKPLAQRKILAECRRQPAARPFSLKTIIFLRTT